MKFADKNFKTAIPEMHNCREIMSIRKIEMDHTQKGKVGSLKKINKTDKSLARLKKRGRQREDINYQYQEGGKRLSLQTLKTSKGKYNE